LRRGRSHTQKTATHGRIKDTVSIRERPASLEDRAVPGHWEGLLNGEPELLHRQGFADANLRMSANLLGAPALRGKEFAQYKMSNPVTTVVGAAVAITLPTGEYSSDQLINLGSNRWIVRPQLGVLHQRNQWEVELTGSVFLFGDSRLRYWKLSLGVPINSRQGLNISFAIS
jgi:hypothetical protein